MFARDPGGRENENVRPPARRVSSFQKAMHLCGVTMFRDEWTRDRRAAGKLGRDNRGGGRV